MNKIKTDPIAATCAACIYFENDPSAIENAFPGLVSMSSAFASVKAQDGICRRHEVYLSSRDNCDDFTAI